MLAYGSLLYQPLWGRLVIKCSHTLLAFSSAANILIYSYKVGYCQLFTRLHTFHFLAGFPVQICPSGRM